MKVLLRNNYGRYRGKNEAWVGEIEDAQEFQTLQQAGLIARDFQEEVDVVLSYEDPKCELALNPVYCR